MRTDWTPQAGTFRRGPASAGRAGRDVGFAILATLSLAIFACVVLGPPYAEMVATRYELDCLRAELDEAEAWIAANARLIKELPEDEVMTKRLASIQFHWLPADEYVVIDPADEPAPQRLVNVPPRPMPPKPDGLALRLAQSLADRTLRNVLLLIAAGCMLASVLLFAPRTGARRDNGG